MQNSLFFEGEAKNGNIFIHWGAMQLVQIKNCTIINTNSNNIFIFLNSYCSARLF